MEDGSWDTPRGMESWVAQPNGGFALKSSIKDPLEDSTMSSNVPDEPPVSAKKKKPMSMAELKAAGRAKVKAQNEARQAELAAQERATTLWETAFDYTFDSTTPSTGSDFLVHGRTVIVIVPGFSSWASLTQAHVDRWKDAALCQAPAGAASDDAISLAFKWPCGQVTWSNDDAQVEAAAAWQLAHEATFAAARSLVLLLQKLKDLGCTIVVAAHSLGARVALQALANDLAAPKIDGLLLLGAAVDNYALTGLSGLADEQNGLIHHDEQVTVAPAEFPFNRLMGKCASVVLAHTSRDQTLTTLWQAAEYARCGRVAPPALGATGPDELELELNEQFDEEWMERVLLLDVTPELGASHDPMDYLLAKGVRASLRAALFDNKK